MHVLLKLLCKKLLNDVGHVYIHVTRPWMKSDKFYQFKMFLIVSSLNSIKPPTLLNIWTVACKRAFYKQLSKFDSNIH